MICNLKSNNIPLNTAGNVNIKGRMEYVVWLSIFFSFISRLPIWPFHYWISSINSSIKNPLVFIISNLVPLMGLYGFIRFWPNTVPKTIAVYAPFFEIICVITMLFIALISLSNKDMRYKLFAYTTVYYLLFLIGIFMPTNILKHNIGYSLFSYIIIVSVLSFLISHVETQKKQLNIYSSAGILCYMPRTSKCISLFILAGIGLPFTPLFWNNFIIISEIFNYNLVLGIFVMFALFIVGVALLEELYKQKDKTYATSSCIFGVDLSNLHFGICMVCILILFLSFFKPLWFVF
jgi:NADH-quinone oxidoreductase subunit M